MSAAVGAEMNVAKAAHPTLYGTAHVDGLSIFTELH
jgi:hypothetical protein